MKIVALSDTHGFHRQLQIPDGDVIVHAGDFSRYGTWAELEDFDDWYTHLPHERKILVPGNHDEQCFLSAVFLDSTFKGVDYLVDDSVVIDGIKFHGSPWTPRYGRWSFMLDRWSRKWDEVLIQIPRDTDVLITHGPPLGICDLVGWRHTGSKEILDALHDIGTFRAHVFGHIHEGHGVEVADGIKTTFLNVAICTGDYEPTNPVTVFEI